jgi:hypothetical protein
MTKMAPVMVDSVGRVRVWRGQDAVLPCVFHGYPPPKIKCGIHPAEEKLEIKNN